MELLREVWIRTKLCYCSLRVDGNGDKVQAKMCMQTIRWAARGEPYGFAAIQNGEVKGP